MAGTVHLFEQLPLVAAPPPARTVLHVAPARATPLVGVIRNPRSHRGGARFAGSGHATLLVETPDRRSDLSDILRRFADQRIDYLAVEGGDGTVRDVLTCGSAVFGDSWPPLIVLPSGKTNALAIDLGLPTDWSLDKALAGASAGSIVQRRPLIVSHADNPDARVLGFVMGAGLYTTAIALGQEAHNRGAFNAAAVAVTTLGAVLRALIGGADNPWRRTTRMNLRDADGALLPHSGQGRADERALLFASTLGRLPAGLRPFRKVAGALRMIVMDNARPCVLLRTPLLLAGRAGRRDAARGYHLAGGEAFEVDVGDRFILDGEAFPAGRYRIAAGPKLRFVSP